MTVFVLKPGVENYASFFFREPKLRFETSRELKGLNLSVTIVLQLSH